MGDYARDDRQIQHLPNVRCSSHSAHDWRELFATNQEDPRTRKAGSPHEAQVCSEGIILERLIGHVLALRRLERSDEQGIPDKVQPV